MAYPTGTDSNWFVGDYASRYGGRELPPTPRAPDPSEGRVSYRAREAQLDADVRKGAGRTVAGFIANFDNAVQSVSEMLGRGDFTGAKTRFDELQQVIHDNQEEIDAFARYTGGGRTGKFLSDAAWGIKSNKYFQNEVTLRDGTTTTLGRAFDADNGLDITKSRGDLMNQAGFEDPAVHAAYFGEDARLRSAVQLFVDPALRQDAAVRHPGVTVEGQMKVNPIHRQLSAAASYVASNWSKDDGTGIADVFGDGAQAFLQSVFASHRDSGGISTMIEALTKNAASVAAARPDLRGSALVNHVVAGYDDMIRAITRGDDRVDARGNRITTETSPESRAMADASLVAASMELMRRGTMLDFRDPMTKSRALELMGEMTRLGDDRVNVWALAKDAGVDIAAEAGKYIAGDSDSSNFFYNWRDFRTQFGRLVKGGHTVNAVMSRESGRPGDYAENLAKKLGEQSSVPALDNMKSDIWAAISSELAPEMLSGANARTAMTRLLGDPERAERFVTKIDSAVLRPFAGAGRFEVARALSSAVLEGLRSGSGVSLEDELFRIGFEDQNFAKAHPAASESARNWYYGSVAPDLQFAELKAKTLRHLMSDAGGKYSAPDALAAVARMSEESAYLARRKRNGALPFMARLNMHERYQEAWSPVLEGRDKHPKLVARDYKPKEAGQRVSEMRGADGKTVYVLERRRGVVRGLEDVSRNPLAGTPEDMFRQNQFAVEYANQQDNARFEAREKIRRELKD